MILALIAAIVCTPIGVAIGHSIGRTQGIRSYDTLLAKQNGWNPTMPDRRTAIRDRRKA